MGAQAVSTDAVKPLVLIPQYFGCLVFDRRSSRYLPFDRNSTDLLLRALEQPLEGEGLEDFLEPLHEEGFWDLQGCFDGEVLPLEPPDDHLAGPLVVHLEVAAACNLSCGHCFAGSLPRREEALRLDELDRLFAELAAMGCFRLSLTGGEPLLRKDLLQILDGALARGLCPSLTTNGLLLTEELAEELGRRSLVWLNVSLDGATPASNDPIRGAGSWQRVCQKLTLLRGRVAFSLAFTLTSTNVDEVQDCLRLAEQVGAAGAVFRPLYPTGKARAQPQWMPSYEQYCNAVEQLTYSPQSRGQRASRLYTGPGCGAANLICSVSLGGTVNPCSYLGSEFEAGNLRQRSFADIWHQSQRFRQLRGPQPEEFRGGCRARAQALAGSATAADPWHEEYLARGGFAPAANWEA